VIHRLGAEAPKKSLVENYMIEIARNYKVDYDPDPSMFLVVYVAPFSLDIAFTLVICFPPGG
jgi:vacuolar protein sorting-associated protein IST1